MFARDATRTRPAVHPADVGWGLHVQSSSNSNGSASTRSSDPSLSGCSVTIGRDSAHLLAPRGTIPDRRLNRSDGSHNLYTASDTPAVDELHHGESALGSIVLFVRSGADPLRLRRRFGTTAVEPELPSLGHQRAVRRYHRH